MTLAALPAHRGRALARAAAVAVVAGSMLALAIGCSSGRRRTTVPPPTGPKVLTVPTIERMVQMGTQPTVIVGEIQKSGMVYRLTSQQTRDLRAVGMPTGLINQMELTYRNAVRKNPQLTTSAKYWTQIDNYWYGGLPFGWPRDWVDGAKR
jgi:hypothetical protein